jgi:hypothetical protein
LVEHLTFNQVVVGSSPTALTKMFDAINGLLGWRQNRPSGLSGPQPRDEAVAVEQFKVSRQSGMLTRAIERVLNASGLNQHCFNNVTKGPHDQ